MAGGRGAARAADRNPHLGGPVTGGAVRAGRDPRAAGAAPEPGGRVPEPGGRGRSRGARGPWHRTRHHRQHRDGGRPMTAAALTPTPATAARVTLPSAVALALARTRLELRQFFRERDAVIFIFAYPIIMLAIFATVFADQEIDFGPGGTLDFATYFLPGMIATGVLLSSFQNLAIGIAEERDAGGLKRLRGTPFPSQGCSCSAPRPGRSAASRSRRSPGPPGPRTPSSPPWSWSCSSSPGCSSCSATCRRGCSRWPRSSR